ncbi:Bax inhibitor-1/YccA family protein [Alcaligenaceae bacterium]|nr:Bax inhibitor-1/YccA family protein [Alcaligenaceae bacterium]
MNDFRQTLPESGGYSATSAQAVRNRVMRNTYWLLTLSLIPTVLGALVGLNTGINQIMGNSPGTSAIVFLIGAFGLMYLIQRNRNSSLGVALLLAFTFFMGIMLSRLLGFVLGMSNGSQLIMMAFGGTAIVFGVMASVATTSKRDFSNMHKFLIMGVVILIVASLANIFLQLPALMLTISVMAIAIFSALLLVDLQRVINGGETNYVTATLTIYLDVYNIFTNLLMLLGIFGGNRD